MEFKEQLKELRSKLGLSQAALSSSLDIPKRTIENWEAGSRIPASWVQKLLLEKLENLSKNLQ